MEGNETEAARHPSLVGDKVVLRAATPDDIPLAHKWLTETDPDTVSATMSRILTPTQASELFRKKRKTEMDAMLMILRKKDDGLLGIISFYNHNSLNRSAEISILIDPEQREKGFGKDAAKVIAKFLFLQRGLNKIYAQVADFNTSAVKLFESLGFKKDGTLRDHHFYKGEFHKSLIYSLLRYELDW